MILAKGRALNYAVPSFLVFNADIVEVKFQWEQIHKDDDSIEIHIFNEFTRNSEDLNHPLSGIVHVEFSYDCAFKIKVSIYNIM